ncbi:MAG: glycoside hydrolase family 2 protein, partial [Eubacteriales bacterium]|nr:glycoside hydrolase family 2 protein [Eubacteriales bacterium]
EAVSYKDGKEMSRQILQTPGHCTGFRLVKESDKVLSADGQSLSYIWAELIDDQGNPVPDQEVCMQAEVTGAATLQAFGAGTPVTEELYTTGSFTSYRGKLLAVVRSGYESGEAVLTVKCEEFGEKSVTVKVQ